MESIYLLTRSGQMTCHNESLHADKLLFGSDNGWWSFKPGAKPALEYAFIDELKLPKEVEDKICRGNAERLFWSKKPEKTATK